ncbi:MAG: hypothetical protein FD155_2524 [Bacteroidetes bacterium]|nr:MAG: hypothetical protein FD155_2524 [Bacteroidota bacterium]
MRFAFVNIRFYSFLVLAFSFLEAYKMIITKISLILFNIGKNTSHLFYNCDEASKVLVTNHPMKHTLMK